MIDPAFSVIIGVIVGGIITFLTTYIVNERRHKHDMISEGIAFYRSMLKEVLPLLGKVEQLRSALVSVKAAKENAIKGMEGLTTLYFDLNKGFRHVKDSCMHARYIISSCT